MTVEINRQAAIVVTCYEQQIVGHQVTMVAVMFSRSRCAIGAAAW